MTRRLPKVVMTIQTAMDTAAGHNRRDVEKGARKVGMKKPVVKMYSRVIAPNKYTFTERRNRSIVVLHLFSCFFKTCG
jgi:hypothetical protein